MNLRSLFLFHLSLAIATLIPGCSSVPSKDVGLPERVLLYAEKSGELEARDRWALKGRLAVHDGEEGGSGHLDWQERGRAISMSFHGALGRGAWQLHADENGAVLEMADGEVYRAKTSSELIENGIGWKIPVTALAWWVRGITAPGNWEVRELDEHGNLLKLSQQGWKIEYSRYRESDGVSMPAKLTARRPPYTVKLIVQNWNLQAETGPDE